MSALRWLSILLLALAVVAGAAWWLQRESSAQLRGEIALLRDEHNKLATLRAENAKLVAAQPSAAELERLRADRAAIVQLRGEIEKLKAETDANARSLGDAGHTAQAPNPATQWKNAGRAMPDATVETLLWAVSRQDIDTVAAMLTFEPRLRPSLDAMFEVLPESVRTQYGTVERLIAGYSIKDFQLAGMHILAERQTDPDSANVRFRWSEEGGGGAREIPMRLVRGDDGWRVMMTAGAVQNIANTIGLEIQAERAAKKGG